MDAASDLRRAARSAARREPAAVDGGVGVAHDHSGDPNPAIELVGVLADAVRGGLMTAEDAELIAASRIAGTPLATIAARRRKRAEALLVGAGTAA